MSSIKAKLKSTEFWFSLVAIFIGGLMGAGVIGDGTIYSQVGGWIIAALGSSGYTVARTLAKAGTAEAGKAGYKTSEFWKALAVAILAWVESHDLVPKGSQLGDMLGQLLTMLPVGTYMIARGAVKATASAEPLDKDLLLPMSDGGGAS